MKHVKYLFSLVILVSFLGFISCGGDDEPAPTLDEKRLDNIVGTWSTGTVTLNNNPAPGDWSNFSITFTQQKGASVSGDPKSEVDIFSISTYDFGGGTSETTFDVVFNGMPAEVASVNISGSSMTMSFTLSEGDKLGAKVLSVEGDWVFNLSK